MTSFDDIRPYHDNEVAGVISDLLEEKDFLQFLGRWQSPQLQKLAPWLVEWMVKRYLSRKLDGVSSIGGFQDVVEFFVTRLISESITQFEYLGLDRLDPSESYLFISNHRDIAGDSMLLNYALYHSGLDTVQIAVGDNLIQRRFATDLMKLNKSFFIKRTEVSKKKMYAALMQSSEYIKASQQEGQSVWIAQSEGRAKDGIDKTDPAVIKMLVLCNRKDNFAETIERMRIVPMSLAYEFDPCDEMKARELYSIAQSGHYEKEEGEDLLSLVQGLGGFKGRVLLRLGEVLSGEYSSAEDVASEIDRQVIKNLELYPINYWAVSKIHEKTYQQTWEMVKGEAVDCDVESFEARLLLCDERYRDQWLKMYANPVVSRSGLLAGPG